MTTTRHTTGSAKTAGPVPPACRTADHRPAARRRTHDARTARWGRRFGPAPAGRAPDPNRVDRSAGGRGPRHRRRASRTVAAADNRRARGQAAMAPARLVSAYRRRHRLADQVATGAARRPGRLDAGRRRSCLPGSVPDPLADPYLLGVAAGAGLGATIVAVSGGSLPLTPPAAFAARSSPLR